MAHPLPSQRELRSDPRKPVHLDVRVSAQGDRPVPAVATNLSVRGLEIVSREPLQPGCPCTLSLTLPIHRRPRRVSLNASVVRSVSEGDAFRAGLVVYGLPPDAQDLLDCFVNG